MSEALDDWEQAEEYDIKAPVAASIATPSTKKTQIPSSILARSSLSSSSPSSTPTSASASAVSTAPNNTTIAKRGDFKPILLRRDSPSDFDLSDQTIVDSENDSRTLHERNRALWDKANSYEQPIISRADNTRTEYVPEIKILRRPKSPVHEDMAKIQLQQQMKAKTLAQREADYNAAREKIFGTSNNNNSNNNTCNNDNDNGNNLNSNINNNGYANRHLDQKHDLKGSPNGSRSSSVSRSGSRSGSSSPLPLPSASTGGEGAGVGGSRPGYFSNRPIEFKGVPPTFKLAQKVSAVSLQDDSSLNIKNSRGSGGYNVIRQPQGPSSSPQQHSKPFRGGGGGRGNRGGMRRGGNMRQEDTFSGNNGKVDNSGHKETGGSVGFRRPLQGGLPRPPS
ncbi:hypothetical protein BCR41DRAFT_347725 [Lobosporangium transversale]|uniref:SUZ domain-containing protein n=1 Tax=Lobosporangium transversale TaxID=64571 RepID=A0A1Y2GXW4_9FUNG|nr:hypothetical protein BCR41DRAFT_347725 [Lobosporangium transversale]ORZ26654.1 hypothetical protein BCR41DRAFT_347725 [Lobosporangium transversale]|eukprot:XP_021884417.1 hypothetical protein BCR41DRAFT_347725 [Lobosporangium transversale]